MIETTIALILFLFPLAYSPGPGNMFFAATGARFGFRATLPASAGYHVATWIVTAAIGFGFITAIDAYPRVFALLKVAGALYVLWIAWKILRSGALTQEGDAKSATFIDGVILLLLNPKAYVIILLMFTQFADSFDTTIFLSVIFITTVFTLNNLLAFSIWSAIGDTLARYFRSPGSAQVLNIIFAGILAIVAVWMLLS